ncbi:hypothetical protein [Rhodocytophaga rosea]|uniref:hypothetical protein n=1 Tax=Rhodocytophaga rosea TaxID=2704465 RepID=UPI001E61A656|nr:hypothetical protein [Rhodocytophaga rosea]
MVDKKLTTILFLFPYPHGTAASQRFRFEQYLPLLKESNITYTLASFLDEKTWHILYKKGHLLSKAAGIIKGFLRRIFLLFSVSAYDFVFIHREASPIGPRYLSGSLLRFSAKK